jgi:hypothetical protein
MAWKNSALPTYSLARQTRQPAPILHQRRCRCLVFSTGVLKHLSGLWLGTSNDRTTGVTARLAQRLLLLLLPWHPLHPQLVRTVRWVRLLRLPGRRLSVWRRRHSPGRRPKWLIASWLGRRLLLRLLPLILLRFRLQQ